MGQESIFGSLLLTILILGLVLCFVLILYLRVIGQLKEMRSAALKDAGQDALKILEDATRKAGKLVKKMRFETRDAKKRFGDELEKVETIEVEAFKTATEQLLTTYREALGNLGGREQQILEGAVNEMEKNALSQTQTFAQTLTQETVASENVLADEVKQDYELLKKKLGDYQTAQMAKIDEGVYRILATVSKDVLGKALSLQEHQELVRASLNEAKQQGVLGQ